MNISSDIFNYLYKVNENYLLDYRILLYNMIKYVLNLNIKKKSNMICLNKNGNINLLNFMNNKKLLTKLNKYSDVYLINLVTPFKHTPEIIIKSIPLSYNELRNMYDTKIPIWKELYVLQLLTKLSKKRSMPNLPIIYDFYICNSCTYENPHIKDSSNKMCLLVLSEYNKYTLKDWIINLSNKKHSVSKLNDIWYNCLFQIIASLYFLYKNYKLIHADLHWNNILVQTHEANGYWIYKIDNIKYYLPNLGFTMKLWDFGKSHSNIIFKEDSSVVIHELIDINRFSNIYNWINITTEIKNKSIIPLNIINLLQNIKKNTKNKLESIIYKNMSRYMHNKIGEKINKYIKKDSTKVEYADNFYRGEIVSYNNKYALVQDIYKFKLYLIINISNITDIISVKYTDVYKILTNVAQNNTTYFNEKNIGIYNL